jgi:hypothetical protein
MPPRESFRLSMLDGDVEGHEFNVLSGLRRPVPIPFVFPELGAKA